MSGIYPGMHPYTSVEYSVRTFRHALALDERRARFRPTMWNELTPEQEKDIDVDIPVPERDRKEENWTYVPPKRDFADVKEVWFAGDVYLANSVTRIVHIIFRLPR
jgi:hypothetical protein